MKAVSPFIYLRHPNFDIWSSDSRYVIFSSSNQYGAAWTNIFDTQIWGNVVFSHPCSGFEMSNCSEHFQGFTADNTGVVLGKSVIRFDQLEPSRG